MMHGLTVWQPWASLIAAGAKPFEWRRWTPPRSLRGRRLAIHASARKPSSREIHAIIFDLQRDGNAGTSLNAEIALPLLERWATSPGHLPLSSILCTVQVGDPISAAHYAVRAGSMPAGYEVDPHMWGWPLTDIRQLEPMVPWKGAQGLWQWNGTEARS